MTNTHGISVALHVTGEITVQVFNIATGQGTWVALNEENVVGLINDLEALQRASKRLGGRK